MTKKCLFILLSFIQILLITAAYLGSGESADVSAADATKVWAYRIVIRTAPRTLELYYHEKLFRTYSVAVGSEKKPTPAGDFIVTGKSKYPGGAFGTRWIGLSASHIGIHGTNRPESIGYAESAGCIRMINKDIEELYGYVRAGMRVSITRE